MRILRVVGISFLGLAAVLVLGVLFIETPEAPLEPSATTSEPQALPLQLPATRAVGRPPIANESGSNGTQPSPRSRRYTLDVSRYGYGGKPLSASANAFVVFPIQLNQEYREPVRRAVPREIYEIPTKSGCGVGPRREIPDPEECRRSGPRSDECMLTNGVNWIVKSGKVQLADAARIMGVGLQTVGSESFCVGFHVKDDGWVWDLTDRRTDKDTGLGELSVDESNVDLVGFLFPGRTDAILKLFVDVLR